MPPVEPESNELFRFGEIAFDVAQIYGVTTEQGLKRARRALNRAMLEILGHDRKWSFMRVKDSFFTASGVREYSLQKEVRKDVSNFWMEGTTRGRITRIPTTRMLKVEPDPALVSGTPRYFDYEGVDSSGCVVISLYPTPPADLEIFHRYTRRIRPIDDDEKDVRVSWGLPDEMLNTLVQKAAAMCVQGASTERYLILHNAAEKMIEEAYAADQSQANTSYIAPMIGEGDDSDAGPRLPVNYER